LFETAGVSLQGGATAHRNETLATAQNIISSTTLADIRFMPPSDHAAPRQAAAAPQRTPLRV
jgi:hypothetical protein